MSTAERQAMLILPPPAGQQFQASTSTTAGSLRLSTIGPQTATVDSNTMYGAPGASHKYIRVSAITADVYVTFGATNASVVNVSATATGTNQANTGAPIFSGTFQDFRLDDRHAWMGYVSTGTGYIHVYINSPE